MCALAASVFWAAWAQAQSPSSTAAEALSRDPIEQRRAEQREAELRERLAPRERAPQGPSSDAAFETPEPAAGWPQDEAPCFPVHRLRLVGDASERFAWVLEGLREGADAAIGRCLGARGLSVAAQRAQRALLERGFVTSRILVEPQDLSGGELQLTLLPGRIGAIRLADGSGARARLFNALPLSLRVGEILNLRDIEQALENLRRLPTVQASIELLPGQAPGQSELIVHWQQTLPLRLDLSLDDAGARSTGRYQGSASLAVDHWWTLNDLFYLSWGRDLGGGEPGPRGTRNASLHYSMPLGHWALAFNSSRYRYAQTVAGFSQDYRYSGRGAQQDLMLSRVLQRDEGSKTSASLKAFARQSRSFIDDTEIEVQRRRTGGWELAFEQRRQIGRAQWDGRIAFRRGTGAFGALPAPEEAFDEGRSRFALLLLDLGWSQPFELAGLRLQ